MATDVKVPAAGESISEVYIGTWLKKPGDEVAADEAIVELETDKATLEVPAPAAGVLLEVLKKEGEAAGIGEVIARIDESATAAAQPAATAAAVTGAVPATASANASASKAAATSTPAAAATASAPTPAVKPAATEPAPQQPPRRPCRRNPPRWACARRASCRPRSASSTRTA